MYIKTRSLVLYITLLRQLTLILHPAKILILIAAGQTLTETTVFYNYL